MRHNLAIFAIAIIAGAFNIEAHSATVLRRTTLSIAGCSQPIRLILSRVPDKYDVNPSDFDRIEFRTVVSTIQFHTASPQMRLRPSVLNPREDYAKLKGITVDKTGYFLRAIYHSDSGERPLLLFLGWPSGSDPGSLLIVGFHSGCIPYQIFQSDNFELKSIQLDSLGLTTLVGKRSLSQVIAGADGAWLDGRPYATTYDPYSVYRIGPASKTSAIYSLENSRNYNQAHYCWAGPQMSEEKAVVYNRTKRSQIECMTANRARNIVH